MNKLFVGGLSRLLFVSLFLFCTFVFPRELIVRFAIPVAIEQQSSEGYYRVSDADLQKILDRNPPVNVKQLFSSTSHHHKTFPAHTVQLWRFANSDSASKVAQALQAHPAVAYAYPNTRFAIAPPASDSLTSEQWYLPAIGAAKAWQTTTGNPSVVVGIIDTGTDYHHPDLAGQLWSNSAEDLNNNGRLDSSDINYIDDDGNGYIDDVIGWDFTDAPAFPDRGDYLDPDNDPMDEYFTGHGTQAAGIIAAGHNGIGIQGVAPGARVMTLRAGTASGFLEEDDVAEAIIYATDNGANIINMSFGDVAVSYLLQDAIRYGVSQGVLFIASSGNSGTGTPNFPAAFDETISVGATNSAGSLAGFSNYGAKLDLIAPGQDILSTEVGGNYGQVSGTSFSAPIVAAIAALVWSKHSEASAATVKGILLASCNDLGFPGWDIFHGHGIVRADAAVQLPPGGIARIDYPSNGSGVHQEIVAITGTAIGPHFTGYQLAYGVGESPVQLTPIATNSAGRILNDTLGLWEIAALTDTVYTLSLTLQQAGLPDQIFQTLVTVDRSPPQLAALDTIPVLIGSRNGFLFQFSSDDRTTARIRFRKAPQGAVVFEQQVNFLRRDHNFLIDQENIAGLHYFDVLMTNSAGLETLDDNGGQLYPLAIQPIYPEQQLLNEIDPIAQKGFLLDGTPPDINFDGRSEIIMSALSEDNLFGPLEILHFQNDQWQRALSTDFPVIPRDARALSEGEGIAILLGFGGNSLLLGGNSPGQFPSQIVWSDTLDFWASRLSNLAGDTRKEILGRKNGRWSIIDIDGNYQSSTIQEFPDTTQGTNQFGVPLTAIGDLDNDGLTELFYTDSDGDLYRLESNAQDQYRFVEILDLNGDAGNSLLQIADSDGDGQQELITVTAVSPVQLLESNINTQFWRLEIWEASANGGFLQKVEEQNFQGITRQNGIYNGLSVADLDGNDATEIIVSVFPDAYVFRRDAGQLQFAYFIKDVNSNAAIFSDFDGNGIGELLINSEQGIRRFQFSGQGIRPPQPVNVRAIPLDTSRIQLTWDATTGEYFRIYRGGQALQLVDSVTTQQYLDSNVVTDSLYTYAIASYDKNYPEPQSTLSNTVTAIPNPPPTVVSVQAVGNRQVHIVFSEKMGPSAFIPHNYRLETLNTEPQSITRSAGSNAAILTFADPLPAGAFPLTIFTASDASGTPLPNLPVTIAFSVAGGHSNFYVVEAKVRSKNRIDIIFSQPVDAPSATRIENYHLDPNGQIVEALVDSLNPQSIILTVGGSTRIGSLGSAYYLSVDNVRSSNNQLLNIEGSRQILLSREVNNLEEVTVFPNPYNSELHHARPIVFANLPSGAEVRIFSASGQLIRLLTSETEYGGIEWDLTTDAGNHAASGVYIYVAKHETGEKIGKFVLINR